MGDAAYAGHGVANYQLIDTINPSVQGGPQDPILISKALSMDATNVSDLKGSVNLAIPS